MQGEGYPNNEGREQGPDLMQEAVTAFLPSWLSDKFSRREADPAVTAMFTGAEVLTLGTAITLLVAGDLGGAAATFGAYCVERFASQAIRQPQPEVK